jgi:hypothetical protein
LPAAQNARLAKLEHREPGTATDEVTPSNVTDDVTGNVAPIVIPVPEPLARAVETLSEQLGIANRRIDARYSGGFDGLHTELANARTAAMITGCEAAALRTRWLWAPNVVCSTHREFARSRSLAK